MHYHAYYAVCLGFAWTPTENLLQNLMAVRIHVIFCSHLDIREGYTKLKFTKIKFYKNIAIISVWSPDEPPVYSTLSSGVQVDPQAVYSYPINPIWSFMCYECIKIRQNVPHFSVICTVSYVVDISL
jgi:hypothetical protein